MKLEVIASDLDGTLLNDAKKISAFTEKTLIDFQKQNKTVILASGRYKREIERYAQQLHLKEYDGFMVCGNGYEVIHCATGDVHTFDSISKENAQLLVSLAEQFHLIQYIQIEGKYHLSVGKAMHAGVVSFREVLRFIQNHGYQKGSYTTHLLDETVFAKNLIPLIQNELVKICVIGTPQNLKKYQEYIQTHYPDRYSYYYVNDFSIEICDISVSKKNAVKYVCECKGYTLDNVIAFGDSGNDEPLLQAARIGVTMKNGSKRALKKARIMSDYTNHEDGVAKACLKYIK